MWQTSENIFRRTKSCFDNYCGSYKITSLTHNGLLKTQISEQKATFPVEKTLWPVFSRSIERDKTQRTISRDQKVFCNFCASFEFLSIGPKRLMQHKFVKKTVIHREKRILANFLHYRVWKAQKTICKDPKSLPISTLEGKRSFL